jgi:non-specific serine/threonine protein kinase
LFRQTRAIAEEIGDESALAYAIQYLGGIAMHQGDAKRGLVMYEDALAQLRKLEDRPGLVILLFQLGVCNILLGDVERALAATDESLRVNGDNDEHWCRAYALYNKALCLWMRGDYRESAELAAASIRLKHQLGNLHGIAHCLEVLSWVAAQQGRHQRTAWLMGAAHVLWMKIGSPLFGVKILRGYHDAAEQCARQALGQRDYTDNFQVGMGLTLDQVVDRATGDGRMAPGSPTPGLPQNGA